MSVRGQETHLDGIEDELDVVLVGGGGGEGVDLLGRGFVLHAEQQQQEARRTVQVDLEEVGVAVVQRDLVLEGGDVLLQGHLLQLLLEQVHLPIPSNAGEQERRGEGKAH